MEVKELLARVYPIFIRALKTMIQTTLGMITVGSAIDQVNWQTIVSVSLVSGIYSVLNNILTGLPETTTDGTLKIDTSDPNKDVYRIDLGNELANLGTKKRVVLNVDPNADLSQK